MRPTLLAIYLLALACALVLQRPDTALAANCNGLAPTIQGTDAPEVIDGTPGDDVIDGAGGDDFINGLGGNDTICGGFGDDVMIGGPGNDYIDGQGATTINAVDYINAPNPVVVTLSGIQATITADGTDTVRNILRIRGSNFDDTISGYWTIFGADGNDTLTGDDNRNTLSGGPGDDTLNGLGGADVLQPGSGIDTVNGGTTIGHNNQGGNIDTIDFTDAGGPITMLNGRVDTTATGDGTDTVNSVEQVFGSEFADVFTNDDGFCLNYFTFGGDDTVEILNADSCRASVAPGAGDDTVSGDSDIVNSLGSGPELIYTDAPGPVNVNLMTGLATGEGTDTISRISGVRGSKFDDIIVGDDRRNRNLFGDEGDDEIYGMGNVDHILGGPGDDILDGGSTRGTEDFGGGPGLDVDIVDYVEETFGAPRYASAGAVNINLVTGVATGDGNDTITEFESAEGSLFNDTITLTDAVGSSAFGSTGDDTIHGGALADTINGGAGFDTLNGNDGNDSLSAGGCFGPCGGAAGDTLNGGAGNDELNPSGGNDIIDGGPGTDELQFSVPGNGGPAAGVTVNLMAGSLTGFGTSTLSSIENVVGTEFDDTLIGDDNANRLEASFGVGAFGPDDDIMQGNGGNDFFDPLDGDDTVTGGAGMDTLSYARSFGTGIVVDLCAGSVTGAGGNDTVSEIERVDGSGAGDTITGCTGNEYLFGGSGDDTLTSGGGTDTLDGGTFFTDTCNGDADETYINCEIINSGCAIEDPDCDGVVDVSDNCVGTTNADQKNTDAEPFLTPGYPDDTTIPRDDALGDLCDQDDDNDGVVDATEAVGCFGLPPTDPLVRDTDGDRVIDGAECALQSDGTDPLFKPATPAPGTDADGDGLSDDFETNSLGADPNNTDTDGDGILDGVEYKGYFTFLTSADSDNDGCSDAQEIASVDGNSAVNSLDLLIVAVHFLDTDRPVQDLDKNGQVNSLDLLLAASNFDPAPC